MLPNMSDTTTLDRPNRFTRGSAPPVPHDYREDINHIAHRIGPHSRPHSLARIDGRTKEGAVFSRVRRDLTAHIGQPNIVERMIIDRCAWLAVRLALLDRKIEQGKAFTQIDSNTYLAWHNSFVRSLRVLGIKQIRTVGSRSSINEYLASLESEAAE